MDKIPHTIKVRSIQKFSYVDAAAIDLKGICLTGLGLRLKTGEVSRGHSSWRNELRKETQKPHKPAKD